MRFSLYISACLALLLNQAFATDHPHHQHHQHSPRTDSSPLSKRQLPPFAERNLATIRAIYNLTVYPNNDPIVKLGSSQVPPGLFSPSAIGRVSPVGEFSGFNDSIEYFFALAPVPSDPEFQGVAIYQADVVEFTSGCPGIAASLVYLRTGKVDPKTGEVDSRVPVSTLSQVSERETSERLLGIQSKLTCRHFFFPRWHSGNSMNTAKSNAITPGSPISKPGFKPAQDLISAHC